MSMEAANEVLIPALRQYCHNSGEGLAYGYDIGETQKIVAKLLKSDDSMAEPQVPSNLTFEKELANLINRRSLETNMANTPDFLLARYIVQCLQTYQYIVQEREHWYGRGTKSECTDGV